VKIFLFALLAVLNVAAVSAQTTDAQVRVLHASPDAPPVNVRVNGNVVFEGLPYKGFTGYVPLRAGTYVFEVEVAPMGPVVLRETFTVAANVAYTFMAVGRVSGGSNPLQLYGYGDDPAPVMGQARFRVVHAAPSAPSVDVYASSPYLALGSLTPALRNVPFAAAGPFLSVPAGLYQARVTVAGTRTVAIDSGAVSLMGNTVRTVVALDPDRPGGPFQLLFLPDAN
jgi:hypothetical protein